MLRAHDFEAIKNWNILLLHAGDTEYSSETLNALKDDLLDYHLDVKRLLQQNAKKKLRYRLKIFRGPAAPLHTYIPSFASADYSGEDLGSGSQHISVAALDGSYIFANIGGFPPGGFTPGNNTYWQIEQKAADPDPVIHLDEGQFALPGPQFTPGTAIIDDLFDIEMARLNYAAFLDSDVAKKSEEEPGLTNLIVQVDSFSGVGSIADLVIRPVGILQPSAAFFASSTTSIDLAVGEKTLRVPAGLFYSRDIRVRISSRDDGSRFVEGVVTRYNDDNNDEFRHARSQIANNLHTDGAIGYVIRSKDGSLIVPKIIRAFASGDARPNFRKGEFMDSISLRISPPGLGGFDHLVDALPDSDPIVGAPFWDDSPVDVWTNGSNVTPSTSVFSGFEQFGSSFNGIKVGVITRSRSGVGAENLSLSMFGLEYEDP